MADISQQDLQNLTDAINRLSGGNRMGNSNRTGYSSSSGSDDKAVSGKKKEFVKGMDNVVNAMSKSDKEFNNLYKSTKDVAGQTKELAANFKSMAAWIALVGTATTSAVNAVNASVDTYRDMSNVGQTFTGSMLKMQMAAADAALPLADFAKLIKDNAMAAAVIGTKGLGDMSKGLRASLREFDLLNLTTQDLNDYLSEYTETQRLYGNLQNLNQMQATSSMKDLAIETTKLSQMTGKNRMDIIKQTAQALRDDSMISLQLMNSGRNLQEFNDSTQKAIAHLAALPGEAGTLMSSMLSQTIGRGSAELTDMSSDLIKGGMYGINSMMNEMAEKVKKGEMPDMEEFRDRFVAEAKQNMSAIKWQADTGNQYAKKIVQMVGQMSNLTGKQLADLTKQQAITSTVMRLQDTFNNFSGFLRTKFFTAVEEIFKAFDNSKLKPQLEALGARFGELMDRFGTFLTKVFSPENLLSMGNKLTSFLDGVGTALPKFLEVAGSLSEKFIAVVKPMIEGFSWIHDKFGLLGTAAAGLVAYLGVKGVGGLLGGYMAKIKGGLSEKFNVGHGIDNVGIQNGGLKVWVVNNGNGGFDRGSRGRGRKSGPRPNRPGSRNRGGSVNRPAGRAGGIAGEAANKSGGFFKRAAKGVGNIVGKTGGLWGKLPGLAKGGALGIGASLALDALPDFAGKKVLSAGSNIAGMASTGAAIGSIIPGAGTLIGGLVGGGLGAIKEAYDNWDDITKTTSSIWDGAKNMVSGWFGPSVSAPITPKTPDMPKPDNTVMSEREQQQMKDMLNKAMESNQSAMIEYLLNKNTSESTLLAMQMIEELKKMNRTNKSIADNTDQ